jgi:hypothetical protein
MKQPRSVALLLVVASTLASAGCSLKPIEEPPERPQEVEGTWRTAAGLKLAACANVRDGNAFITVTINQTGTCDGAPGFTGSCPRYSTMKMKINDGDTYTVSRPGGPGAVPSADGNGYPCYYPELEFHSPDLFTETGTVDVRLWIGREERHFAIEGWLMKRQLEIASGTFVAGSTVTIDAGPRSIAADWEGVVEEEHAVLRYEFQSEHDTTWSALSWAGERFELPVPDGLPEGEPIFTLSERRVAAVVGCPFNRCSAVTDRTTSTRVTVVRPSE